MFNRILGKNAKHLQMEYEEMIMHRRKSDSTFEAMQNNPIKMRAAGRNLNIPEFTLRVELNKNYFEKRTM